ISMFGKDPKDISDEALNRFKNLSKGLVSYFNPTFQYNIFAKQIQKATIIATATESVVQRIEDECNNLNTVDADNIYGLSPEKGRCLWWVSNWSGNKDYAWPPKSWKIGWKMNIDDFN